MPEEKYRTYVKKQNFLLSRKRNEVAISRKECNKVLVIRCLIFEV
jgi:hypothetical protein